MQKSFSVGAKTFVLDQDKAEAAYAAKKVINGRQVPYFNILPLKYQWAYDLYRKMKANHWEPEDVPMGKDIEQWRDEKTVSDVERWIISGVSGKQNFVITVLLNQKTFHVLFQPCIQSVYGFQYRNRREIRIFWWGCFCSADGAMKFKSAEYG